MGPEVGITIVIFGNTIKGVENEPNMAENGVVNVRGPSVAPTGTVAIAVVPSADTVTRAGRPLNFTAAPVKKLPVKFTVSPTAALAGVTEATVGMGV